MRRAATEYNGVLSAASSCSVQLSAAPKVCCSLPVTCACLSNSGRHTRLTQQGFQLALRLEAVQATAFAQGMNKKQGAGAFVAQAAPDLSSAAGVVCGQTTDQQEYSESKGRVLQPEAKRTSRRSSSAQQMCCCLKPLLLYSAVSIHWSISLRPTHAPRWTYLCCLKGKHTPKK